MEGMRTECKWLFCIATAVLVHVVAASAPVSLETPIAEASLQGGDNRCKISEYQCTNKRCVPVNRFCDNVNDCGDSSDEPRHCTPCNRTYYGDVGRTYELELHRPKEERLPFICHITLTAGGGLHGDLIQLTLESFTLGRFVSFTVEGCPDGSLQLGELGRPPVGGSWCGSSWGPVVYYSETRSLTLIVRLLRLSKDHTGYNFDFRMEYKMLNKDLATVRYGGGYPASDDTSILYNKISSNFTHHREDLPNVPYQPPFKEEYYLGDLISGTYCSRIFSDCDRKICRLQSPNFPGIYPRNLTCYYAVRQHEVPPGKHALITVRQRKGQLISIRSQSALYAPTQQQQQQQAHVRTLKVWNECDEVQDYVTIYDGYTTRDPVILKFCGGGEAVPEAISSGPELLVEFTTSPYGTFLHPTPVQTLHGFLLEVEVKFVDQQSPTYAKNKRACEFWIRGTGRGVLESPQHSLTPNTTCLYHLQGIDSSLSTMAGPIRPIGQWRKSGFSYPPRFRVWLSVLKFHVTSSLGPILPETDICASHLNVWDGPLRISPGCSDIFCDREKWKASRIGSGDKILMVGKPPGNASLLARYCRDRVPRSCDHSLLRPTPLRPCARTESFLSTGDSMTLELRLADSTSLKPVAFKTLYEFVDLQQDGEAYGSGLCSRRFFSRSTEVTTDPPQRFTAPRDVFLYGRGGAKNLSCVYRFEAQQNERVRITITKLTTVGGRRGRCMTRDSTRTTKLACLGKPKPSLKIYEVPWFGAPGLPRDCLCSTPPGLLPFVFISNTHIVEVRFEAFNMSATDDYKNIFFEASYEFIKSPVCTRVQKLTGSSGVIDLKLPSDNYNDINCEHHPWLIEPYLGRYLYMKIKGIKLKEPVIDEYNLSNNISILHEDKDQCMTHNRVAIYAGSLPPVIICPVPLPHYRHNTVEVFSDGWNIGHNIFEIPPMTPPVTTDIYDHSKTIAVEYIGRDSGSYIITWLELTKRKHGVFPAVYALSEECKYRCPELDACINATLWCDGTSHCPSGYDESLSHCSLLLQLPAQYLAALCAAVLSGTSLLIIYLVRLRRRRRSTAFQRRLESMSSDTAIFGDKEVIC